MRITAVTLSVLLASAAFAQQSPPLQPQLTIRSLTLSGNTVLTASERQQFRHQLTSHALTDINELRREIGEQLLFKYQNRGYFKTVVHEPDIRVVRIAPHREIVDVSVRVEESRCYRLGNLRFEGAQAFSSKSLRDAFLINSGDVFERKRIDDGLERLRHMYAQAGYPNFTSVPDTQIDERHGVISLLIGIEEGKQFHWGSLTVRGEAADPQAKKKLLTAWKPHEGTMYDSDRALLLLLRELGARPSIRPFDIFSLSLDQQSRAVNVEVTLAQLPQL